MATSEQSGDNYHRYVGKSGRCDIPLRARMRICRAGRVAIFCWCRSLQGATTFALFVIAIVCRSPYRASQTTPQSVMREVYSGLRN